MSTGNTRPLYDPNRQRREALEWFVIREPHQDLSPSQQKKWERWAANERNLALYREYAKVDRLLRALPKRPYPTNAELQGDSSSTALASLSYRLGIPGIRARLSEMQAGRPARHALIAAFLLISLLIVLQRYPIGSRVAAKLPTLTEKVFKTDRGAQSTVRLSDDSVIRLGGATRIGLVVTDRSRRAIVYEGEATFNVTHNPHAPFQVDVGAARVTDLGTVFHVRYYTSDKQVIVGVMAGSVEVVSLARGTADGQSVDRSTPNVQVGPVSVKAGQEVTSDATGHVSSPRHVDFQAETWLKDGYRVYQEKPIGQIVQDLRLYSARRIDYDAAAGTLLFNGSVDPKDPDAWVHSLPVVLPVQVDSSDPQRLVIRCRRTDCH